jgi:hypothetical protein
MHHLEKAAASQTVATAPYNRMRKERNFRDGFGFGFGFGISFTDLVTSDYFKDC